MKCPKCQYLSFADGGRCRNCGYEFSLAPEPPVLDLPIRQPGAPEGPLADLALAETAFPNEEPALGLHELRAERRRAARPITGSDLPLFDDRARDAIVDRSAAARRRMANAGAEDDPLVTPPAVPRAPLSVRRSSPPVVSRPRGRSPEPADEPVLDLEFPEETTEGSREPEPVRPRELPPAALRPSARRRTAAIRIEEATSAPTGRRALAGLLDLAILGSINLAVVYFTLRLCDLPPADIGQLPLAPLVAFLLMLDGGYFAGFTVAGGQTIGKMVGGIKVVPRLPERPWSDRVPLGFAVLRAAACLISVAPAGAGFVPAFFDTERRTLHDRLADTRVIRV